jgi:hypothetical protein
MVRRLLSVMPDQYHCKDVPGFFQMHKEFTAACGTDIKNARQTNTASS